MELFEQINADLKSAMKEKDKNKLSAVRSIKAQLLLIQTSAGAKDTISDTEIITVLQKMVKQRKDAADIYKTQNRTDLYDIEMSEVEYIQAYLPKQLSQTELTDSIKKIITELGAVSLKDMGKVIGHASKTLAGKSEGRLIAETVKKLLAE